MPQPFATGQQSLHDLLGEMTWDEITSAGIITIEEIETALRAKGLDPEEFDHLPEVDPEVDAGS